MNYRKLGSTGLTVSEIGLGAEWLERHTTEECAAVISCCEEQGINILDCWMSEPNVRTNIGKAIAGRRDKWIIQGHIGSTWQNGQYVRTRDIAQDKPAFEDLLERLGTDYIDLIVVHYVCKDWPVEETMGALQELIKEGKIRAVGLSNSQPGDLEEYCKYGTVALVQEFFSLLSPYHGGDYFPVTDKHGTTFQVYGALEEGFLTAPDFVDRTFPAGDVRGKLPWIHEPIKGNIHKLFDVMKPLTEKYNCSYSNLVQAWTLAQYPNLSLLTGFRRVETMENTCKSLDLQLEAADIALLSEAAKPAQVKVLDK